MLKDKEQKVVHSAYCKNCSKEIASGSIQTEVFMSAGQHCLKEKHEVVFGMSIQWLEDNIPEENINEHIAFCKICRKNIAVNTNEGKVLRAAMEHCETTKHELAFGVVITAESLSS